MKVAQALMQQDLYTLHLLGCVQILSFRRLSHFCRRSRRC